MIHSDVKTGAVDARLARSKRRDRPRAGRTRRCASRRSADPRAADAAVIARARIVGLGWSRLRFGGGLEGIDSLSRRHPDLRHQPGAVRLLLGHPSVGGAIGVLASLGASELLCLGASHDQSVSRATWAGHGRLRRVARGQPPVASETTLPSGSVRNATRSPQGMSVGSRSTVAPWARSSDSVASTSST